jgi:hypothetical protein
MPARVSHRRQNAILGVVVATLAALCVAAASAPAWWADAQTARSSWQRGESAAAVDRLAAALTTARLDAPMRVRRVVVVNHDDRGLGRYTAAPGGAVDGRRLRLYVEVEGFAAKPPRALGATATHAPVASQVALQALGAFAFREPPATPGAAWVWTDLGERAIGNIAYETTLSTSETSFVIDVALGERSPAGTYRVAVGVKDTLGNRSARALPVEFVLR